MKRIFVSLAFISILCLSGLFAGDIDIYCCTDKNMKTILLPEYSDESTSKKQKEYGKSENRSGVRGDYEYQSCVFESDIIRVDMRAPIEVCRDDSFEVSIRIVNYNKEPIYLQYEPYIYSIDKDGKTLIIGYGGQIEGGIVIPLLLEKIDGGDRVLKEMVLKVRDDITDEMNTDNFNFLLRFGYIPGPEGAEKKAAELAKNLLRKGELFELPSDIFERNVVKFDLKCFYFPIIKCH